MKKKEAKKPAMQKPTMEIVAPTPVRSEELELRLINARSMINNLVHENIHLQKRVEDKAMEIEKLHRAECERSEKKKAAWRLAGHLALLCLFAFGCATTAAANVSYGPWWTAIAPVLLLLLGLKEALKS